MILFDNVSKSYAGHGHALCDISVEIKDGEFVFLIGPSGAGKTTFLRLLIRDIIPTSGKVIVDDWDLSSLPHSQIHLLRRKVGTVFQDFKLLTDRTIFENVALALEILGKDKQDIHKGVIEALSLVGLSEKAEYFPIQLSAGELQRIAIARAIVGGPTILLADEPTGNLDPETAWGILDLLSEVHKLGTTIIMATHNAGVVNDLKKRTIALEKGKIIRDEEKGTYHVSHKQTHKEEVKHTKKHHEHS